MANLCVNNHIMGAGSSDNTYVAELTSCLTSVSTVFMLAKDERQHMRAPHAAALTCKGVWGVCDGQVWGYTDLEQQSKHATDKRQQQHDIWGLLIRCVWVASILDSVCWLAGIP